MDRGLMRERPAPCSEWTPGHASGQRWGTTWAEQGREEVECIDYAIMQLWDDINCGAACHCGARIGNGDTAPTVQEFGCSQAPHVPPSIYYGKAGNSHIISCACV